VFGIAAAVVVGAIAFFASMGPAALDPTRLDWIFIGGLDTSMQFVGWHMFRYDDSWPPATPPYGYPVGTSVALTDSIPIVALFFKVLSPLLPPDFQYLGLWLLLCFIMQAVLGVMQMRTCTSSVALQLLGAALFVLSPSLLHHARVTRNVWPFIRSLTVSGATRCRIAAMSCSIPPTSARPLPSRPWTIASSPSTPRTLGQA
jgi:hypothetical protein